MVTDRSTREGLSVRRVRFVSIILFWLICPNQAQAAARMLFVPPLLIDEGASWQAAQAAIFRIQQALSRMEQVNLVLRDGLPPGTGREVVEQARELVRGGERAYLALDHAKAAGIFAHAAELLTPLAASLDSADTKLLARARFLEGTAWAESRHPEMATNAFEALLNVVPDEKMDDSMLPPKVQPLWQVAVARVHAHKGHLGVRVEPDGADVSLDGRWRGRAPMRIESVAQGAHRLTVSAPGYVSMSEKVNVESDSDASVHNVTLQPTSDDDVWFRMNRAAAGPPGLAWTSILTALRRSYNVESVVMAGLKRASNGDTWVVLERWQGTVRTGLVVLTAPDKRLDLLPDALHALLGQNASPVYIPRPKAPPLDFDGAVFGVSSDAADSQSPAAESSLVLWGSAGQPPISGFGVALGAGLGAAWAIDDVWSFDLIAEANRSTQPGGDRVDELVGRLMVRGGLRWRRMAVSAGLHAGAGELFTTSAASSAAQLVPNAGLLLRFDFDVGDWLVISLLNLAQVDVLGLTHEKTVNDLTLTLTYHALFGLGWRF